MERDGRKYLIIAFIVMILIFFGYATLIIYMTWPISEYSIEKSSYFGDSFGVVSCLFSGLAFLGLIYAIILQRQELFLQRQELSLTRGELQGQKEQLQKQTEIFTTQIFENRLFQMLSLHNQIVSALSVNDPEFGDDEGRACFRIFHDRFVKYYNKFAEHTEQIIDIRVGYAQFYKDSLYDLSHYNRNLFSILKFIDKSIVSDKQYYATLLRSQLSTFEQLLLFYRCLSKIADPNEKIYLEKYGILKDLPKVDLLHPNDALFYNSTAFEESFDE